ncbi:hypothetical protein [Mariniblastus fucicola]|nr:hypothetical protein [Mariniblastus fucicola]
MKAKNVKPWNNPEAARWVHSSDSMRQLCRLVEGTLRLEVDSRPHEIRAAAATVIMLARKNLWSPAGREDEEILHEMDRLVGLAARRLGSVKQLFEKKMRAEPELQSDPSYRKLMESINQEIRILESRMSDSPNKLPEEPPCTWGNFW